MSGPAWRPASLWSLWGSLVGRAATGGRHVAQATGKRAPAKYDSAAVRRGGGRAGGGWWCGKKPRAFRCVEAAPRSLIKPLANSTPHSRSGAGLIALSCMPGQMPAGSSRQRAAASPAGRPQAPATLSPCPCVHACHNVRLQHHHQKGTAHERCVRHRQAPACKPYALPAEAFCYYCCGVAAAAAWAFCQHAPTETLPPRLRAAHLAACAGGGLGLARRAAMSPSGTLSSTTQLQGSTGKWWVAVHMLALRCASSTSAALSSSSGTRMSKGATCGVGV